MNAIELYYEIDKLSEHTNRICIELADTAIKDAGVELMSQVPDSSAILKAWDELSAALVHMIEAERALKPSLVKNGYCEHCGSGPTCSICGRGMQRGGGGVE
jgi:hypothetical protein